MAFVKNTILGYVSFIVLFSFANTGLAQQLPAEVLRYAERVFYNGSVLTVDTGRGNFTIAQALATRDGKILAVGSSNEILRLAGPKTQRIDLNGKAIMPGIIDTHVHPRREYLRGYGERQHPGGEGADLQAEGFFSPGVNSGPNYRRCRQRLL